MRKPSIITASLMAMALVAGVGIGRWTAPLPASANTAPPANASETPPVTTAVTASNFDVVRVIDGDTFKVRYDGDLTSVRILHINTPERGEPLADDATNELRRLIQDQTVELHFDAARRRDSFGRLLCRVTVQGLDVGQHLLDAGLASPYQPGPRRANTES